MSQEESDQERAALDAWWAQEPLCFEWVGHSNRHARFEFSSRGDRVEGWLHARSGAPQPLILLMSGRPEGAGDAVAVGCAERWSEAGAAVARLDLPLHGVRESAKLSASLRDAVSDLTRLGRDNDRQRLAAEFLRQCEWDLRGAVAGLTAAPEIDASRIAVVGVGLGALACAHAIGGCEVHAAVLAELARGGPPGIDGERALLHFSPRPLLRIETVGETTTTGEGERLDIASIEDLAASAWPFLARTLGL